MKKNSIICAATTLVVAGIFIIATGMVPVVSRPSSPTIITQKAFQDYQANFQELYGKANAADTVFGYLLDCASLANIYGANTTMRIYNGIDDRNTMLLFFVGVDGGYNDSWGAMCTAGKTVICPKMCDITDFSSATVAAQRCMITATSVQKCIQNYKAKYPQFPSGFTVNPIAYNSLRAQAGCQYVRVFFGLDNSGNKCIMSIGVDGKGANLVTGKIFCQDASGICPDNCNM